MQSVYPMLAWVFCLCARLGAAAIIDSIGAGRCILFAFVKLSLVKFHTLDV